MSKLEEQQSAEEPTDGRASLVRGDRRADRSANQPDDEQDDEQRTHNHTFSDSTGLPTKIASGDATCNQYGRFTVKLKPNAQARKALKGYKGSLRVTLTLRLAGPIGSTTATKTITLKGKKAKKGSA